MALKERQSMLGVGRAVCFQPASISHVVLSLYGTVSNFFLKKGGGEKSGTKFGYIGFDIDTDVND